jgi:hypothetical protein
MFVQPASGIVMVQTAVYDRCQPARTEADSYNERDGIVAAACWRFAGRQHSN